MQVVVLDFIRQPPARKFPMNISIDKPAIYQIRVKGLLDARWSKRLGGLSVTPIEFGPKRKETLLKGQVADQATLFGVLLALYDMRLPLISVFCLDEISQENEVGMGDQ